MLEQDMASIIKFVLDNAENPLLLECPRKLHGSGGILPYPRA